MKKIMFNDRFGLTEAVLCGRKTQTRRVVSKKLLTYQWDIEEDTIVIEHPCDGIIDARKTSFCNYKIDDVVAVAQSYNSTDYSPYLQNQQSILSKKQLKAGWNNKMFVKSELMPNKIKITGVRVEKLQDISDDDCIKEGVGIGNFTNTWDKYYITIGSECNKTFKTPREAYAYLIDKVSGKGTWDSNPLVWVYDFEIIN